jgi:hypothetical protein
MSKKTEQPAKRGRPKSDNPKSEFVGLRIDRDLYDGAEAYKELNKLDDISSAIRHMIRRVLEMDAVKKTPK